MTVAVDSKSLVAVCIRLTGCVQGSGVRPTIARLATSLDLSGSVQNTLAGLEIEAQGAAHLVAMFQQQLVSSLPTATVVDRCEGLRHRSLAAQRVRDSTRRGDGHSGNRSSGD